MSFRSIFSETLFDTSKLLYFYKKTYLSYELFTEILMMLLIAFKEVETNLFKNEKVIYFYRNISQK